MIDYDRTVSDYEASLVTKLRGHGAGSFLENWVPDPDPVLGIVNMIEAAWTDGRGALELSVSVRTLDGPALERLKELAAVVADIRVREVPGAYQLEVERVSRSRVAAGAKRSSRATSKPRSASMPASDTGTDPGTVAVIHPSLAAALDTEVTTFSHEGSPPTGPGTCIEADSPDGTIAFVVGEGEIVSAARHRGVQPELRRKLVELMCRLVEGRTVQDASDHAAVLAIHRLRLAAGGRPAPGILLPANAGTEVMRALEMVRRVCARYSARFGHERGPNFFEPAPGAAWKALSQTEKRLRAAEATAAFCRAEGMSETVLKAVRIDRDIGGHEIRVIVQMDGTVPLNDAPLTLRRLERFLKKRVEERLQIYLEPLKDKNVLRRL